MARAPCGTRVVCFAICLLLVSCQGAFGAGSITPMVESGGHIGGIRHIEFIGRGDQLLSVGIDQVIRVWDAATGQISRTYYPPLATHPHRTAIAVSPQGDRLILAGQQVESGVPVIMSASLRTGRLQNLRATESAPISTLRFVSGGEGVACGTVQGDVQLWSASLDGSFRTIVKGEAPLSGFATSFAGDRIALATIDGTTRILNLEGQEMFRIHEKAVHDLTFAKDGNTLAILSGGPSGRVGLWNASTGQQLDRFIELARPALSIDFLGETAFCVSGRGFVGIGRDFKVVEQYADQDWTGLMAVSRDQELFATSNRRGELFVWNQKGERRGPFGSRSKAIARVRWKDKGAVSWQTSTDETFSFSFERLQVESEPGQKMVGAIHKRERVSLRMAERVVQAVLADGATRELTLPTAHGQATCYSLVNDNLAVVGSSSGQLTMFRLPEGTRVGERRGHTGAVRDVAPSAEGHYLLSGSDDTTVRVWSLAPVPPAAPQDPLLTIAVSGSEWIAFTPEGFYAATPGGDELLVWKHHFSEAQMARPLHARQLEGQLFRPHVIANLLSAGSLAASVKATQLVSIHTTELMDLRTASNADPASLPPTVDWLEPTNLEFETEEATVRVKVRLTAPVDAPLSEVSIILNSRSVKTLDASGTSMDVEEEISLLPGVNMVSVFARNAKGGQGEAPLLRIHKMTPKGVRPIPGKGEKESPGNLYVLAVGISRYKDNSRDLQFAHRDAEELAAAFKKQAGTLYQNVFSEVVVNDQADRESILDKLSWLVKAASVEDTAMIVFSAHGVRDDSQDYYLAPHDADFERMFSTCIPWTSIAKAIRTLKANRVVLIMDTCHSGGVTGANAMERDPIRELLSKPSPPVVYASSVSGGVSYEDPAWSHGAFSKSVLETFADPMSDVKPPHDGNVSLYELPLGVDPRVDKLTNGRQTPALFNLGVPDFPVVKIWP